MSDEVKISASGKVFQGWKSVSVTRNLNSLAGTFSIAIADKWRSDRAVWPLRPGVIVNLSIDTDKIMEGHIDSVAVSFSGTSREIVVTGRDRTADLVDCSVTVAPFEYKNIGLLDLAKKLIAPFGFSVKSVGDLGDKFPLWTIRQGETVFDSLERAARLRGILIITNENSAVVLTSPGTVRAGTDLVQGENILEGNANYDYSNRYSKVIIKGNMPGSDSFFAEFAASVEGSAIDESITRFRPFLMVAGSNVTNTSAKKRAQWEVAVRAAQSTQVQVGVAGWRRGNKKLWKVGELVRIRAGFLGISQDMLINSVNFTKGDGGTVSNLQLIRPDAYLPFESIKAVKDPAQNLGWLGLLDR